MRNHPESETRAREWTITIGIAAVLLTVMYGVTTHRAEVKDEQRQSDMQRDANPAATQPAQPIPATKPGG